MDTYLYYSYLRFRHNNQKNVRIMLKSIPWWMWTLLLTSFIEVGFGAILYYTAGSGIWYQLLTIASFCSLGLLELGIEYVQITQGDKRYEDFWIRMRSMEAFLAGKGISTTNDIVEVKVRIERRLAQKQQEQKELKQSDEKWLQTLAIPVVLLILTNLIGKAGELSVMIASAISLFMLLGLGCLFVFPVVYVMRYIRRWEISNLSWFVDDLQGVLDLSRFKCSEDM